MLSTDNSPILIMTRRPEQFASLIRMAAKASIPCRVTGDPADFAAVLNNRGWSILDDDLVETIIIWAARHVPGWAQGRFRGPLERVALLADEPYGHPATKQVADHVQASMVLTRPLDTMMSVEWLAERSRVAGPPF